MQESIGLSYGKRVVIDTPKELQNMSLQEILDKGYILETEFFCDTHQKNYKSSPVTNTAFGTIIYSECPECAKDREIKRQQEEAEKQEAIKKAQIKREEAILRSRGCGKKFLKLRNSLKMDTELMSKGLAKYLEHDGSDFINKDRLVILGGCGIGKTFFGNMLVETAYKIGLRYVCFNAFELVSAYKSMSINGFNRTNSFENLAEILDGVDCLIIDEIDYFLRENKDVRDDETLHHISQICEKEDIRTIILGNCNKQELKEAMPPKVYSRFTGGKPIGGWNMQDMRVKQ